MNCTIQLKKAVKLNVFAFAIMMVCQTAEVKSQTNHAQLPEIHKDDRETLSDQPGAGWYFYDYFLGVEMMEGFETLHMSSIDTDSQGNIWVIGGGETTDGNFEGRLFRYQDGEWDVVDDFEIASDAGTTKRSLPLNVVSSLNVYYSDGYNLRRYSHGDIIEYTPEESGLPEPEYDDERMVDIVRDEEGTNWMLYSYPRVVSFGDPEEEYEVYDHENSGIPEPVDDESGIGTELPAQHLAVTGDSLWITTHRDGDGLIRKYDNEWTAYTAENSALTSDLVVSLVTDSEESLWISTLPGESGEGSLSNLTDSEWDVNTTADGLPSEQNRVHAIEEEDIIWASFGGGEDPGYGYLAEYDDGEWTVIAEEDEFFQYLAFLTIDDHDHQNKWLSGHFNVINAGVGSLNQVYVQFSNVPDTETVFDGGAKVSIGWESGRRVENVSISYSKDHGDSWEEIESGLEPVESSHDLELPTPEEPESEVVIKVSAEGYQDVADEAEPITVLNPEEPFYHLRREESDGSYQLYDPLVDGWQMPNQQSVMWPEEKWSEIEYEGPLNWLLGGEPSEFPSFNSLVRAFGEDNTIAGYTPIFDNITPTVRASVLWKILTNQGFGGVCHGFAVTSLLAFTDGQGVLDASIEEDHLFDQEVNNEIREMINATWAQQWSRDHFIETFLSTLNEDLLQNLAEKDDIELDDILETDLVFAPPSQTLEDIKQMLDTKTDEKYHRALLLFPEGDIMAGHSVVVYKAEQDESDEDLWRLHIHDSNFPDDDDTYVQVDLDQDYYFYEEPSNNIRFEGSHGLFLSDPVDGYISYSQVLKEHHTEGTNEDDPLEQISGLEDIGFMHTFFSNEHGLTITDEMGNETSLQDGISTTDIPGSFPVVPLVGGEHDPIGYFLADVEYDVELNYSDNGEGKFQAFSADTIYSYRNYEGDPESPDRMRYGNSFKVYGNDHQFDMEVINGDENEERMYALRDVNAAEEDSIDFNLDDGGSLAVNNYNGAKQVDLELRTYYSDEGYFLHEGIQLDGSTGYKFEVQEWDNLEEQQVTMHIDTNMDGRYDESERLESTTTSGSMEDQPDRPEEFGLEQNYPNPFNAETTIQYSLPEETHVELAVYDILGRRVATLADERQEAGYHEVNFDASELSTGTYIYEIRAGEFSQSKQLLLVK